ncbi:MAG: radical SAM protein [Lachnospiraceae bacterium]|nr:radical SAM protein [Lachnospiraceae bacterium]
MEESYICNLCPRSCNVDRMAGKIGYCGQAYEVVASRAALHMWEEPCISGERGSGTVFFSGCPLRCVYCQNHSIALGKVGKTISVEELTQIYLRLEKKGANNINLVTPTHFVEPIIRSLREARTKGLNIPVVYNTGTYENVETIKRLEGHVQVYLPDLKYFDSDIAGRYSKAPDYFKVATAAISEMVRQRGKAVFAGATTDTSHVVRDMNDVIGAGGRNASTSVSGCIGEGHVEEGIMLSGVIVRHLLLPGGLEDSKKVIKYLYETYGDEIYISIMNQYTPMKDNLRMYPELNRTVTEAEYDELVDYAIELGVENGFIQEGETAKESFIPEFNMEGI